MAIDTLGANALASNSVTTAKIAADAVTSAKIPADAVVAADIADGSVTTAKLADNAVTSAKALNLGRRNLIINGAMQVAQRATSATGIGTANGVYPTVDRMIIEVGNTAGRLTMTQESITDLPGFTKATKLACTTADTSIAASEFLMLGTRFEGKDLQHLKKGTSSAEKVTVSFYVKGNASATYTCELRDQDNTRFNNIEFSVTTSWTRVSLTFDGDTTGVFDNDTNNSLKCNLFLHGGSTYSGGSHTNNVWHTTTNQRLSDSQTSFFDSTSRTLFVTGWQMEVGDTATDFEHRSFGEELALCQRYYCQVVNNTGSSLYLGILQAYNTSSAYGFIKDYPATMRADPSVSQSGNFGGYAASSATWQSGAAWQNFGGTSVGWRTGGTSGSSNIVAGYAVVIFHAAGAKLMADAEI